jgi:hypothetical protein
MATNCYPINVFDRGGSDITVSEIAFRKAGSPNMNKLLKMFYDKYRFPKNFIGKVDKMALCKYSFSGMETKINSKNLSITENLVEGTKIQELRIINGIMRYRDIIFIKWEIDIFYEWELTDGSILQLRQDYVDGLSPKEKEELGL